MFASAPQAHTWVLAHPSYPGCPPLLPLGAHPSYPLVPTPPTLGAHPSYPALQNAVQTFSWSQIMTSPPLEAKEVTHTLLHEITDVATSFQLPPKAIKTFLLSFAT